MASSEKQLLSLDSEAEQGRKGEGGGGTRAQYTLLNHLLVSNGSLLLLLVAMSMDGEVIGLPW